MTPTTELHPQNLEPLATFVSFSTKSAAEMARWLRVYLPAITGPEAVARVAVLPGGVLTAALTVEESQLFDMVGA